MSRKTAGKRSSGKARRKARSRRRQTQSRRSQRVEIGADELQAIVERTRPALSAEEHAILVGAVGTLAMLTQELEEADVTISRLRKLLFGSSSEKTEDVLGGVEDSGETDDNASGQPEEAAADAEPGPDPEGSDAQRSDDEDGDDAKGEEQHPDATGSPDGAQDKPKGHGRNGADAYTGAERVHVAHGDLQPGDPCPECEDGKVYRKKPSVIVRVTGVAPLNATVYELERLRCNLCGEVFTARAPPGVGEQKYDETAAAMMALLKYGCGLPLNRMQRLGKNLGMPMPTSTQWDVVERAARDAEPAWRELICHAADGDVVYIDDTNMQVLDLDKQIREELALGVADRTGIFTSGVISTRAGRRMALFFTGRKHAGENLAHVLEKRSTERGPPIQMCDALARNTSPDFETLVANCLAHARRHYVDVVENFPEEVAHVLQLLRQVYRNDRVTRDKGMSDQQRLRYHNKHSKPLMTQLEKWLQAQFDERRVEPNSTLGKAITYMQNHWDKLTLFLRVAGAPIDNNEVERGLKRIILHRKNSLFYKTENGARAGDIFHSLIHTAELSGANPFEYLVALQRHREAVAADPDQWLPWNYTEALQDLAEAEADSDRV